MSDQPEPTRIVDLMQALEDSLAAAGATARSRVRPVQDAPAPVSTQPPDLHLSLHIPGALASDDAAIIGAELAEIINEERARNGDEGPVEVVASVWGQEG